MATPPPTPTDPGPAPCCSPGKICGPGKCPMGKVFFILILIGGLNWGLIGLGGFLGKNFNVINLLLGGSSLIENIVYILIGLATLRKAVIHGKLCKK